MATPKEELKARADELGLEVTRADGKEGEPTVEDYHDAIAEAELGLPTVLREKGEPRRFEVGGPYKVFGKRRGAIIDAEVVIGDDGAELVKYGGDWAVLQPLIDARFLKPTS
jgi:hypothetical protein